MYLPLICFTKHAEKSLRHFSEFYILVFGSALVNTHPTYSPRAPLFLANTMKATSSDGGNPLQPRICDLSHLSLMYFALLGALKQVGTHRYLQGNHIREARIQGNCIKGNCTIVNLQERALQEIKHMVFTGDCREELVHLQ